MFEIGNFAARNVAVPKSGKVTVTTEGARTFVFEGLRTVGVRSGNNANNSNLSARYLNANNSAGNTNSYYCGSAKVEQNCMMRPSPVPGSGRHIRPAGGYGGRRQDRAEMSGACQLLTLDRCMDVTKEQVLAAMRNAAKGHSNKEEVERMMENAGTYADMVLASMASGEYRNHLQYRKLTKQNPNGKVRKIDSPLLFTFVLQHLFLVLAKPLYDCHDNMNALNCKPGCGITASDSTKSVIRRLKHLMYDRRDLGWCVIIDQRKCYEHIRPKVFRNEMRKLTTDRELVEFGIDVGFVDGRLPIGTPTSPLMHHIVMLEFDHWSKQVAPFSLRYADDCFFATRTKEEANELKWRVQNFWWYELQVRAKASAIRLQPLSKEVSFCGYVVHRNPDCGVADHDKGYTRLRQNIRARASRCRNNESWASYYGLLRHADGYYLMQKIEERMKLRQLTEKIRINRSMDAPNVNPKDLAGKQFTIYDYEIRSDSKGTPNWIKCLIGIDEKDEDGNPTGRMKAFEFHGSYMYLVEFMTMAEKTFGKKNMLPLEEMAMRQKDGTVFVDLFGGSGLVSHIIKHARPDCRVVYNDFDHFSERLANVGRTNEMLHALRPIVAEIPHKMRIVEPVRSAVLAEVERWHKSGFVDWITISSNLLFVMNYVGSYEEFAKMTFYNRVRVVDYDVSGYLEGVEIVSMDYRPLFDMFRENEDVVFILDPPYLSTDCSTYNSSDYWRLSDYLDVLKCLQGTNYVYYTSSKSSIVELADFISRTDLRDNPFKGATIYKHPVKGIALNYEDMMLTKTAA